MWKDTVEPGRPQMTLWRMRITCCIPKATNTLSESVILIDFPLPQWLHVRASVLCYTCIACCVSFFFFFLLLTNVLSIINTSDIKTANYYYYYYNSPPVLRPDPDIFGGLPLKHTYPPTDSSHLRLHGQTSQYTRCLIAYAKRSCKNVEICSTLLIENSLMQLILLKGTVWS